MSKSTVASRKPQNKCIPVIGMLEDDRYHSKIYAETIGTTTGATVRVFYSVRAFVEAVNVGATFDLIVTDVMMRPDGVFTADESEEGRLTGVCLVKAIREAGIGSPVIIQTFHAGPRLKAIKKQFAEDQNVFVFCKIDLPPHDLADRIRRLLEESGSRSTARQYWERFIKSLQARPNFFGFGVDLKKLFGSNE